MHDQDWCEGGPQLWEKLLHLWSEVRPMRSLRTRPVSWNIVVVGLPVALCS